MTIKNQEEEKLVHIFQFLFFLKIFNDRQKDQIKKQFYYGLKFLLSQFVKFTGNQLSHLSNKCCIIEILGVEKFFTFRTHFNYLSYFLGQKINMIYD